MGLIALIGGGVLSKDTSRLSDAVNSDPAKICEINGLQDATSFWLLGANFR